MSEEATPVPGAENPEVFTGLSTRKIKKVAAGIPAIISSVKKISAEAGLARGMKALWSMNKKGGFDCPSCAWPDPDDERSRVGEYCENGARAVAEEATSKKLTPSFFKNHSVEELSGLSDYEIGKKGRIAQPMFLPKGATHYQPISWEDAFGRISNKLKSLASPDEAVFYTSGRTSNEAAFLYQLFVRMYGTNNLPDCSNMCHESSSVALGETLGVGKASVTLEDFYKAQVIMILGQNPGTNHPRMLTALQKAKANGAIIISANPLPETGLMGFSNPQQIKGLLGLDTALTDIFLHIKINGDMAMLQAIEQLLLKEEETAPGTVLNQSFINNNTEGFESFINHIRNLDLQTLCESCGIGMEQLQQTADVLKKNDRIIVCWAMGLTQHKNAVDTIKEIVNLLLMKGSIGKPGAGTCPVRGHSNVQGDRTMGIYEQPSVAFLQSLENNFQFSPPLKHGYDTVGTITAMHNRRIKFFMAMGGNFLSATPDTNYTAAGMKNCEMTVQVSTKLNRSHLIHGEEAIILPCFARSDKDVQNGKEQFVSCENSMGVVQSSKGVLKPVSRMLLSEPVIVCRLAKAAIGNSDRVNWDKYAANYDAIRSEIEKTIAGFENYNERVRQPGGFYLPNANRDGRFKTVSGKAHFTVSSISPIKLEDDELMMMTIRSHDQFNTTIYGLNDRYRGIFNERRVILLNEVDISRRKLQNGDVVNIFNYHDGKERIAKKFIVIAYPIPEKCSATYFPETNVLVPITSVADKSNTPTSKMVIIKIKKAL